MFLLAEKWINGENVVLILWDNIFHGFGFSIILNNVIINNRATILGYRVSDPERFRVVEFDDNKKFYL